MACTLSHRGFHGTGRIAAAKTPRRRGFLRDLLRALLDAVMLANQRQAQRDIDRFVARRGKLTDSLEREIGERVMGGDWNVRH
ncbi:MAG: hypothetical protein ACR2K5_13830 [Pseudolabrys sp.]